MAGEGNRGQQFVFDNDRMREAAKASFLRQSLVRILSDAEKHEARNNPFSLIRKKAHSEEDFMVGYLVTDAHIMKDPNEDGEDNKQIVAFVHSASSDEILIMVRDAENADLRTNSDVKMFILPWPPVKTSRDEERTINIVRFLIEFAEKADAWDEFESKIPSIEAFLKNSFLKQKDLENLRFLDKKKPRLELVENTH